MVRNQLPGIAAFAM